MRIGAAVLPARLGGGAPEPDVLAETCRTIERLGYDSIWVFDAVGRGMMLPDPLMTLTVAATVTEGVELGTGVLQVPIRNVPELAYRILTLHLLAGERLLLGLGPGSTEADFATFTEADHYAERFARFRRELPALRHWLATGDDPDGSGRSLSPWPAVAGGPAVLLAGWRGRWVEEAAASAGWIASAMYADDAQLADGLARFRAAGGTRAIVTNVQVGDDIGPAIERLRHLAALGFDDAVVVDRLASEDRLGAILDGARS